MFTQNIYVFVKIFIFVTTPLKVYKYGYCFLNKKYYWFKFCITYQGMVFGERNSILWK